MANEDLLRAMMQRRTNAASRTGALNARQRGLSARANAPLEATLGGGSTGASIAGRRMDIPQEQSINWGGIAERGLSRYQEAQGIKDLERAQEEEVDAEFDVANEIYQSTMKDDPEGAKLIRMAQMGVPGADQALAKHLTPKTQSLAVIVQAMTTGKLDPDMAAELAPQYGLSPEMVKKGAAYATQQNQIAQDLKFQQKVALRAMSGTGGRSRSGKLSFDEYQALDPEDKAAYDRFSGIGGRNVKQDGMTPGQANVAAKEVVKSEANIREGLINVDKGEDLRKYIEDPDTFGTQQKLSQVMANSDVPVLGGLVAGAGTAMRSKGAAMLEEYVNSEVLKKMAALGGNDSNEELRQMRMVLPSALNNQETAKALYEQVLRFQKRKLAEEREYQKQLRSGEFFQPQSQPPAKPSGQIEILEILD